MTLNAKQARFVAEYLIDLNATQAATRAGYSEKTAYSQGQRLLKDAEISSALEAEQAKRAERTEITQDRTLREFGCIGFSDIRKLFTESGALKPIAEWDDDIAAAVASVEVVTKRLPGTADEELDGQPHGGALKRNRGVEVEYLHKIKLWDKNTALDKIARHLGMLKDKLEHDVSDGLAKLLKEIDGRTRGIPNGD